MNSEGEVEEIDGSTIFNVPSDVIKISKRDTHPCPTYYFSRKANPITTLHKIFHN